MGNKIRVIDKQILYVDVRRETNQLEFEIGRKEYDVVFKDRIGLTKLMRALGFDMEELIDLASNLKMEEIESG